MKIPLFALPAFLLILLPRVTVEAQIVAENSLQAVEVVGVETTAQMIRLTLKNVSPKNITAIDFATSENNTKTIDSILGAGDVLMGPSVDKVFDIGITPGHPPSKVGILAVVFEDGTGEGVPAQLDYIKNIRLARRDQMRRVAPLWSNLLIVAQTGNQQELGQLLNTTLAEVSALPETPAIGTDTPNRNNVAQEIGLKSAKQDAASDIGRIQQRLAKGSTKEALEYFISKFKDQYDKILAKLEKEG